MGNNHLKAAIEEHCKQAWESNSSLPVEFGGDFAAFVAFALAEAEGLVQILGNTPNYWNKAALAGLSKIIGTPPASR